MFINLSFYIKSPWLDGYAFEEGEGDIL